MQQKRYECFTDSGHGWVRVPRHELAELNIEDKISKYSYMRDEWVYLEEDVDAYVFFTAKGIADAEISDHINEHYSENYVS